MEKIQLAIAEHTIEVLVSVMNGTEPHNVKALVSSTAHHIKNMIEEPHDDQRED